jgi:hypothetical protein
MLPPDAPSVRVQTANDSNHGSPPAVPVAPPLDRANIRPLDIVGALQILLAEVKAELDLRLLDATPLDSAARQDNDSAQNPVQAARELVEVFLLVMPDDASDAGAWTAALVRVESGFQSSVNRAVETISVWRDVPQPVLEAAKETRALAFSALNEEAQNSVWLRPEWVALAPKMQRFWRYRRRARRRLSDPDYDSGSVEGNEKFRP